MFFNITGAEIVFHGLKVANWKDLHDHDAKSERLFSHGHDEVPTLRQKKMTRSDSQCHHPSSLVSPTAEGGVAVYSKRGTANFLMNLFS